MGLVIHRIPALSDNYIWLLVDEASGETAVVDPAEAAPVENKLDALGLSLGAIWNTHHHRDHVGGNRDLLARWPDARVYGSRHDAEAGRIPGVTDAVDDGSTFWFAGMRVDVDHLPGHTRGHVAYRIADRLFCGDVLFGAGCGRLFEGTPAEMQASLARLRELPDETRVHCAHEYTWHNLRFAIEVEPGNPALRARHARVAAALERPTVPTTLGEEKATNPFLRWDADEIRRATGEVDPVAVFAAVRRRKDGWRG